MRTLVFFTLVITLMLEPGMLRAGSTTIPSGAASYVDQLTLSLKDLPPDDGSELSADMVRAFKAGRWIYDTAVAPKDVRGLVKVTCGNERVVLERPDFVFESETSALAIFTQFSIEPTRQGQEINPEVRAKFLTACKGQNIRICIRLSLDKDKEWVVQQRPATKPSAAPATQPTAIPRGSWSSPDNTTYSAKFFDEAGHAIVGEFNRPVTWDTTAQQQLQVKSWDDLAKLRLADNPDFRVSNKVVRQRLKGLAAERVGTLSGNVMELQLVGKVNFDGKSFTRLETDDGEYTVALDDVGKKLSNELNGKKVTVKAQLNGSVAYDMVSTLSSPTSGNISSVVEVPKIKIASFAQAK